MTTAVDNWPAAARFVAIAATRQSPTAPSYTTRRDTTGRKSWVVFYRFGEQKRLTIEPGYLALGLAAAREEARAAMRAVAKGHDPAASKQEAKAARQQPAPVEEPPPDTIEKVIDEFMQRHTKAQKRSPRYIVETRRNFDKHVLPRWRGRLIGDITRRDVIELLDAINDAAASPAGEDEGPAKTRRSGGPIAANRTHAALSKLFNWALSRDIIEAPPMVRVAKTGAEVRRERALTDDEIRTVWRAAAEGPSYPFSQFFRMLLATGQRRGEVATMRWADIDTEEKTWTLPASATKAARGHVVPLSPLALKILAECPQTGADVFAGRRRSAGASAGDAPINGFGRAKERLDAKAAEIAKAGEGAPVAAWHVHDLRRTAAIGMGRLRVPRFTVARVLNHADGSVTGIYDRHEYLDEKRQALDAWGQFLENLTSPPGANVVPLRRA